ncbi:MAG: IclR family transcriptional regulator [Nocardioidaceae bacterium]
MSRPGEGERAAGVQSVDRAFVLLELTAAAEGGAGLSQLADASGLPVPTIHRIMGSLVESGHVLKLSSRRYALGPRMVSMGESAARTLEGWTQPHLATLAEATGETANMAMLDRSHVVYIAQATSRRHTVRMFTDVGSRVLAHCTAVGKLLLAQLPSDRARAAVAAAGMPAHTDRTITDPAVLDKELDRIRQAGYAVDDEEHELGVRCAAVAVPGLSATALSVSGPAGRLTEQSVAAVVPMLVDTARNLAGGLSKASTSPAQKPDAS